MAQDEGSRVKMFEKWLDEMPEHATHAEVLATLMSVMGKEDLLDRMPDVIIPMLLVYCRWNDQDAINIIASVSKECAWTFDFDPDDFDMVKNGGRKFH